jgi:hypothetical protein
MYSVLGCITPGVVAGFGIIKGEVMGTGEGSAAGTDDVESGRVCTLVHQLRYGSNISRWV